VEGQEESTLRPQFSTARRPSSICFLVKWLLYQYLTKQLSILLEFLISNISSLIAFQTIIIAYDNFKYARSIFCTFKLEEAIFFYQRCHYYECTIYCEFEQL